MKVTGFTIARNAVKYGYPIKESICSILPLCDEFVIAVGESEDNTLEYLRAIDSDKIRIIETVWNETLMDGGKVLAVETDKAYQAISKDTDWCFYIQADEIIHEQDLPAIKAAMEENVANKSVEGFVFNYHHFYHSYNYIGASSRFYKHEVRIIRRLDDIYSYRDAQGFRRGDNIKIKCKQVAAHVYHYGWVRPPEVMYVKQKNMSKYYHDDEYIKTNFENTETYDYSKKDAHLVPFQGTHPSSMQAMADDMDWPFDLKKYRAKLSFKDRMKLLIIKYLGINPNYANYTLLK